MQVESKETQFQRLTYNDWYLAADNLIKMAIFRISNKDIWIWYQKNMQVQSSKHGTGGEDFTMKNCQPPWHSPHGRSSTLTSPDFFGLMTWTVVKWSSSSHILVLPHILSGHLGGSIVIGVTPSYHPFLDRIFPEKKPSSEFGVPPWWWKLTFWEFGTIIPKVSTVPCYLVANSPRIVFVGEFTLVISMG